MPSRLLAWLSAIVVISNNQRTSATSDVILTIADGPIRGVVESTLGVNIHIFRSVPFAQPPVGDLRFQSPKPIQAWTSTVDCTPQPNACSQLDAIDYDRQNPAAELWLSTVQESEDCLYLSVWTPSTNKTSRLPVIVWIYGGAFVSGSGSLDVYDGAYLAASHEVVVVNIPYRVGPLGFLYLNSSDAPGNQGILDVKLGLDWIQRNIVYFGGNRNKVTLMGESAGAVIISLLAWSPFATLLFQNVILQSATLKCRWALDEPNMALRKAKQMVDLLNCTGTDEVACLRNVDVSSIFSSIQRVSVGADSRLQTIGKYYSEFSRASIHPTLYFDVIFRPIIDGQLIPHYQTTDRCQGNIATKRFLVGTNRNEASYFLLYAIVPMNKLLGSARPFNFTFEDFNFYANIQSTTSRLLLLQVLSDRHIHPIFVRLIAREYNIDMDRNLDSLDEKLHFFRQLELLAGDLDFKLSTIDFAIDMKRCNASVYAYSFSHKTAEQTWPDWLGVMHGYEIEYVTGMWASSTFQDKFYDFNEEERNLSKLMMTYWTNFAKYGDPNGNILNENVPYWKPLNVKNPEVLHLTSPINRVVMRDDEISRRSSYWSFVLPKFRNLLKRAGCVNSANSELSKPGYRLLQIVLRTIVTLKLLSSTQGL